MHPKKPIKCTLNINKKWFDGINKTYLLKKWLNSAKVVAKIIQIIPKKFLVELNINF